MERLNEIFHRLYSAVLYDLWFRQEDIEREKLIVQINLNRERIDRVNGDYEKVPMFVIYGWIASTILFFVEIIWFKILHNVIDALKKFRIIELKSFR